MTRETPIGLKFGDEELESVLVARRDHADAVQEGLHGRRDVVGQGREALLEDRLARRGDQRHDARAVVGQLAVLVQLSGPDVGGREDEHDPGDVA